MSARPRTRAAGRRAARCIIPIAALAAAALIAAPPAAAQTDSVFVAANRAACRAGPTLADPVLLRLDVGDVAPLLGSEAGWARVATVRGACWVAERLVVPREGEEGQVLMAAAERMLERDPSPSAIDYGSLGALIDGEIARLGDDAPPLLELTRLHVLDAAARRDFRGRTAWVQQHVDRLRYFETGGVYRVAQRAYEDLYERHRDAPEADRLAWEYLSRLDPGECEDDASCWLDRVERSYAAYWQRFPEGPYVEEALTRAAEILEIVARYACWTGQDDDTRVPGERVSDLEASVRALDAEGRERVLELVAQIRERCP